MSEVIAVDSSACIALLLGEKEQAAIARVLGDAAEIWMGAFSLLETAIVIAAKKGPRGLLAWDALRQRLNVHGVALTAEHVELAREAWLRFGKGRHPAALNLGDCCSYAVAKHAGVPLLFKGDDFSKTDLQAVPLSD